MPITLEAGGFLLLEDSGLILLESDSLSVAPPNGRWREVYPVGGTVLIVDTTIQPMLGEVGFTLFMADPAGLGIGLGFTKPSGTSLLVGPPVTFPTKPPNPTLSRYTAHIAYPTQPDDLDELGMWSVYPVDFDGRPVGDQGTFMVQPVL